VEILPLKSTLFFSAKIFYITRQSKIHEPPKHFYLYQKVMAEKEYILIKGAREHNLKNIDVEIPHNKLVVITGLFGSGMLSLAFDMIYAEGQTYLCASAMCRAA